MADDGASPSALIGVVHIAFVLLANCASPSHAASVTEIHDQFSTFDANGAFKKDWFAKLQRAKTYCSWEDKSDKLDLKYDWFPTDKDMREDHWGYFSSQLSITTYWPAVPGWLEKIFRYLFISQQKRAPLQNRLCKVVADSGEEFRIRRLGPFSSHGGFDWHKMKLEDPYDLRGRVHGETISMTGFGAMPVDEVGQIIGNPPIHVHHANLGPNCCESGCRQSSLRRVSQWHGDSQCSVEGGGSACYITVMPEGFSFSVKEPLRLDADLNDVRPHGSSEMQFYLESAISIVRPKRSKEHHALGTIILGVPFRFEWWKKPDFQRLYYVPRDQPTALWSTAKMPTSGTFLAGKLETHQHMFDLAWVFTGVSPEDLGLNSGMWQLQRPWLPWQPLEHGWKDGVAAMTAFKAHVTQHFEKVVTECRKSGVCQKVPSLVWTLNTTVIEDDEDRQMPFPKPMWSFEEGDQYTMVIVHKAMAPGAPGHGSSGSEMAQHLAITGHYLPKVDGTADYHYILPSIHARWAWYDAVDWMSAFANWGGSGANDWPVLSSLWLWLPILLSSSIVLMASAWCARISIRSLAFLVVAANNADEEGQDDVVSSASV